MRFTDQYEAGRALAARLEVSKRLGLPLDLVLLRRLLVASGPAEPLCAASVAGTLFLDGGLEERAAQDPAFRRFFDDALAEFDSRVRACRGGRPAADLSGKTALLVDNGVRTGSTMLAAIRAVRSRGPARVVAAAPVAAPEGCAAVGAAADDFVCLARPEPFGHVGLWYADFRRASDGEIRSALEESPTPPA